MRKLKVIHSTRYDYGIDAFDALHTAHLTPGLWSGQVVLDSSIEITPQPSERWMSVDYFSNPVLFFRVDEGHQSLEVTSELDVDLHQRFTLPSTVTWAEARTTFSVNRHAMNKDCWPFFVHTALTPHLEELKSFAEGCFVDHLTLMSGCLALMEKINTTFEFDSKFSTIHTPLTEIMRNRRGVCQDFTHLMLSALRSMGIPCRYVSGYLETLPPPGREKLVGVDASHAWVSCFMPDVGWVEFDPTNNIVPSLAHVVLAYGRDYYDVCPLKGFFYGASEHQLKVSVDVREIEDVPASED